jgi:cysteine desulfurase/selenocysteine lyase
MRSDTIATNFFDYRQDFPILSGMNRGKPLVYLDSASSAQKPRSVVDAMTNFYSQDYANIHRGIYELSERATSLYEQVRLDVAQFIHAHRDEVVLTSGTTAAINLVAQSYGRTNWKAGDEVIVSEMEHHSNIVPWVMLKEQIGIILKVIPVNDDGSLNLAVYQTLFSPRTKMVAITHVSNVIGTINPVKEMIATAHAHHVPVLVDGAQAVSHMPLNMQELDCDFYIFSAHKVYGPTGTGVLYGKKALLDAMPPYQGGGGMIETVSFEHVTYAPSPQKFEAGTPDIVSAIGFSAALDYVTEIGLDKIAEHELALLDYAETELLRINGLRLIGTARPKAGVISFVIDGIHPHDIGTVLDHEGIAIRAGHHCAMPLMQRFNVPATVRVSFGIYNTKADIDALISALELAGRIFK